ncbi:DNA-directed RNA polymerase subunit beta' [Candidatus Berkelbacteria bacterium]|nr:DNA-directed RNA polymerase subunit beta' [Candidatus Berkelbacteria bacterium]
MNQTSPRGKRPQDTLLKLTDFNAIRISVASPEKMLSWSYGEVLKPETINYRTQKPERDGLFDERIFGPTKDWECYCGKYKKIRYKGVICDKCGVEVTRSAVRRERMGHIELAAPVAHIWYVRGVPSILSQLVDVSVADLEKVIYFAGFIVLGVDEELRDELLLQLEAEYKEMSADTLAEKDRQNLDETYKSTKQELTSLRAHMILSEERFSQISLRYGNVVRVGIGAEAILELLQSIDLSTAITATTKQAESAGDLAKRKLLKRLQLFIQLRDAHISPEWFVLGRIPVIPPDLRPMVQLDGGRFAASDLNDLYRRVLNRNNRLKKLLVQGAPEVICRNEKRMLQEAVDSLIDNSARRGRAVSAGATQRRLRSLSDMLRGKQGRFRQNLLGKRVDYSGRSVIVVGPDLALNQCGIPKSMALELFKPFVISKLISEGYIQNVKNAARLIEKGAPEVWDVLERVTAEKFVLLNRAPTLHRLGIQAFKPVLIEGKAIQLHPLVCYAYNADFDGDQMAVHVPLSTQSTWEAANIMQSSRNLLKPASGEPVVSARLDMVYGAYYLTTYQTGAAGEGKSYSGKNEAILAHQMGDLHVRARINVKMRPRDEDDEQIVETSVGRILFNNVLPHELRFRNNPMDSKELKKIVYDCFRELGTEATAQTVDKIKKIGFQYGLLSGMSIAMTDITIPSNKDEVIRQTEDRITRIGQQYQLGLMSDSERRLQTIREWERARDDIGQRMGEEFDPNSPVFLAVTSKARGSLTQLNQMAGMKGLVVNPAGEIIESAITANFKEGLTELQYFTSTHAARKGKSDTALRTSDAGYLTRRLVDVSQDVVIEQENCGTTTAHTVMRAEADAIGIPFGSRLSGRIAATDLRVNGTVVTAAQEEITVEAAAQLEQSTHTTIDVRSPLYCEAPFGLCQLCYGRDLATGKLVELGEVVGIMAAQAIGEPGTQLTLNTFHSGGVAGVDVTTGLPRVEELFEARAPKSPALMSDLAGTVKVLERKQGTTLQVTSDVTQSETVTVLDGYEVSVTTGDVVIAKQVLATAPGKKALRSSVPGTVTIQGSVISITATEPQVKEYLLTGNQSPKVKSGQVVKEGDPLTEGHLELGKLLRSQGIEATQRYIVSQIQEIYSSQGQEINDKHIEIILRQMFAKVLVTDSGASDLIAGQLVDRRTVEQLNLKLASKKGKQSITYQDTLFGVTRVALTTDSFLSAASFQETTSVLIDAAVRGAVDPLAGLKENVIIGRLIPAGTGFHRRTKRSASKITPKKAVVEA